LLSSLLVLGGGSSGRRVREVPMGVACVCWAHATLRINDPGLFDEVAEQCSQNLKAFKHLELSNVLWSFAKLGEQGGRTKVLFKAAASEALSRPDDFNVVNLSTLVWSFATARVKHGQLFDLVAKRFVKSAGEAESQEIANTAWAFATAGVLNDALFAHLGDEAVRKLESFKPQEAANVAWAFGRAELSHVSFFQALERRLRAQASKERGRLSSFEPQHMTMVLQAASLLYAPPAAEGGDDARDEEGFAVALGLMVVVLPECLQQVHRFKNDEASRILTACSRMRLRGGGVLPSLADGRGPLMEELRRAADLAERFRATTGAHAEGEQTDGFVD